MERERRKQEIKGWGRGGGRKRGGGMAKESERKRRKRRWEMGEGRER